MENIMSGAVFSYLFNDQFFVYAAAGVFFLEIILAVISCLKERRGK